jgi:hypothetical protein
MDFNFTEEQLMISQVARDYAERELILDVLERDAKAEISIFVQILQCAFVVGFFTMNGEIKPLHFF